MRRILHILTGNRDELPEKVISLQSERDTEEIAVADLTVTEPDYALLLEEIFKADSIEVW